MTTPITDAMRFFMNPMWPAAGAVAAGTALSSPDAEAGMRDVATRTLRAGLRQSRRAADALEASGAGRGARALASNVELRPEEIDAVNRVIRDLPKGFSADEIRLADAMDAAHQYHVRHPTTGVPDPWAETTIGGIELGRDKSGRVTYKVVPKQVGYNFHIDPATGKEAARQSAHFNNMVERVSGEILDIARRAKAGDKTAQRIMAHAKWYEGVQGRLSSEYGSFMDTFGDLLGSTSPNTPVVTNFAFSKDLLRRMSRGDFDARIDRYADTLDEIYRAEDTAEQYARAQKANGRTLKAAYEDPFYRHLEARVYQLKRDLNADVILQENGKEYGMNSKNAMVALADRWRIYRAGSAPKAKNFSGNLVGYSDDATIDVWSARNLRRHAGLPPVPVAAQRGVSGLITDPVARRSSREFGFGQDVLAQATQRINAATGSNLTPKDVQALQWFAEKEYWNTRGWSPAEGGSFEHQMNWDPVESAAVGVSRERPGRVPTDAEQKALGDRIVTTAMEDPDVRAAKAPSTEGLYGGARERALDVDIVSAEDAVPVSTLNEIGRQADIDGQESFLVARRINPEVGLSRPHMFNAGAEVYFRRPVGKNDPMISQLQTYLQDRGVVGFTLIVDPRKPRGPMADQVLGIRYLDVPQYYAPEDFAKMAPEAYASHVGDTIKRYGEIADELARDFGGEIRQAVPGYFDVNVKRRGESSAYLAQRADPARDPDVLDQDFWGFKPALTRFKQFAGSAGQADTAVADAASAARSAEGGFASPPLLAAAAGLTGAATAGATYLDELTDFAERRAQAPSPYKQHKLAETLEQARAWRAEQLEQMAQRRRAAEQMLEQARTGFIGGAHRAIAEATDPQALTANQLLLADRILRQGQSPAAAMLFGDRVQPNTNPVSAYFYQKAEEYPAQGAAGTAAGLLPYFLPPFSAAPPQ